MEPEFLRNSEEVLHADKCKILLFAKADDLGCFSQILLNTIPIGILVGKAVNFANSASGLRLRFKY